MKKGTRMGLIAAAVLILGIGAFMLLPDGNKPGGDAAPGTETGEGTVRTEKTESGALTIRVDGKEIREMSEPEGNQAADIMVYITVDGDPVLVLPFGEEHRVEMIRDSGMNVVRMTEQAVWMEDADCEGRDCVQMGEVTRDNLETRVMGGFIICLPHRISVEVRGD